jgi:hypothetical protein
MKTCALYGFVSAVAGALLILAMFFLGLHSDIAKLGVANTVGSLGTLAISMPCTLLGVKARRNQVPPNEPFGYGRAFGTGFLITLIGSAFSSVFLYAYHKFINPGLSDILLRDSFNKLEAQGLSGDRLERMEAFNRILFTPVWEAVVALVFGIIVGAVVALLVASVLKRPPPPTVRA